MLKLDGFELDDHVLVFGKLSFALNDRNYILFENEYVIEQVKSTEDFIKFALSLQVGIVKVENSYIPVLYIDKNTTLTCYSLINKEKFTIDSTQLYSKV